MGFSFLTGIRMNSLNALINDIALLLKKKQWQLVTAESCTGGLIASAITEVPGSSQWFERGFVTYSNLSKQEMLGVPQEIIEQFGAVSEQVAAAMAMGALQHSKGHIALSVTGIAGPEGGSIEKPVGTVCFAWAAIGRPVTLLKKQLTGDRKAIRLTACQLALEGIRDLIK